MSREVREREKREKKQEHRASQREKTGAGEESRLPTINGFGEKWSRGFAENERSAESSI